MTDIFTQSFFTQNRHALKKRLDADTPIVVAAHGLLQRTADSTFPFVQDSNFWYLTGIQEPDLILVIDSAEEYLIVPSRSGSREAFDGSIDFDAMSRVSGIQNVLTEEEGLKKLGKTIKQGSKVQTLPAPAQYIEQYGMYTNPARARLLERLHSWQTELEVIDIREHLVSLRMIKQPPELEAIQHAIDTTIAGLKTVSSRLSSYTYEFEIENDLTILFRTSMTSGHAFAPIVASGKRACTLHNVANDGKLLAGELLVLDVGAEASHYAADITRTVALGEPTARQSQILDAVLEVQKFAAELLKPGTFLKEYEAAVEHKMGEKLIELGLIKTIDHDSVRRYYPHATSHFLGLDVHDVGDYSRPLEAGMVLTNEPGIYIPEEGIGIRIEDDVRITETGNSVLSDALPRTFIS